MILAYDNKLKGATITTTSENANYPLANIHDPWKRKVYRTVDGVISATISVNFGKDVTINSFFIAYHNATAIEVRFYDLADTLLDTWTITNNRAHGEVLAYKAEIELSAPVTLYVGTIFLGSSLQYDKEADQDMPMNSTDVATFSSDYQVAGRRGSVLRSGTVSIPILSYLERESLEQAFINCGLITPFFLDLWESSPTMFSPLYGVFTSSLSVTHRYDGDDVSFSFTEVN
jgi:hypothetical protein